MSKGKQRRRQRELERQRATRGRRAHETQRAQAEAAARTNLQRRRQHKIQGALLITLGAVIAVLHVFEHAGTVALMSQGLEDLLLGFPMAALLTLLGLIRLGT